jgi:hypothetical protein
MMIINLELTHDELLFLNYITSHMSVGKDFATKVRLKGSEVFGRDVVSLLSPAYTGIDQRIVVDELKLNAFKTIAQPHIENHLKLQNLKQEQHKLECALADVKLKLSHMEDGIDE